MMKMPPPNHPPGNGAWTGNGERMPGPLVVASEPAEPPPSITT
jgi:hypothetical protein